jgi:hypothetical protein
VITVVFTLILLYEQSAIMRVGRYIRLDLEPVLMHQPYTGWETWLEKYSPNRRAESFFALSAYLAFSLYYLGGSYLAFLAARRDYGDNIAILLTAIYAGGFLLALYFIINNFATNTRTQNEGSPPT